MPREDAAALAAALDALLDDPVARRSGSPTARAHSSSPRYALDAMLDRMERVFRRALDDAQADRP